MKGTKGRARLWRFALPSIVFAATIALASQWNLLYRLDNSLCDLLYQEKQPFDGRIFVLGIDERALAALGPIQTWERGVMADIVDALNQNPAARPAAIGLDMMYYGETDPENDARLEAKARAGQVLMSESVYNAVKNRVEAVSLGEISLDGKTK